MTSAVLVTKVNPAGATEPDLGADRALAALGSGRADALPWLWAHATHEDVVQSALQNGAPLVRSHAAWIKANREAKRGATEASADLRLGVGWIDRAWLAPARPGDRDAAALRAVPATAWRPLAASLASGAFRPAGALVARERGAAWLLLVIHVDTPARTHLRLGTSGRATLIVPGADAIALPARDEIGLDQAGFRISLPAGPTAVALHLADEDRPGQAILRWTRPNERPLSGAELVFDRAMIHRATAESARQRRIEPLAPLVDRRRPARSATALALRATLAGALGLDERGDPARSARRDLEAALAEAPDWAEGWQRLGRRLAESDTDRARTAYERAVELDPKLAEAWVGLGDLARRAERPLAAARAYDRAIEADTAHAPAWAKRSELGFDALGETALAVRRLETSPVAEDPRVCAQLARVQMSLGDSTRAEARARAGLEADATHGLLRALSFDAAARRGDLDDATRIAEAGLRLEPDRPRWYIELARVRAEVSPTDAAELIEAARARFPSFADVHVAAAELDQLAGREDAARDHVAEAARREPGRRDLASWLADLDETTSAASSEALELRRLADLPGSAAESRHGAAVLRETREVRLSSDGSWTREIHRFVRVRDPERHPEVERVPIDFAPSREAVHVLTARRISADGRVSPAEDTLETHESPRVDGMYVDQSTRVIDLGGLEPGDVFEIRYRVESLGPNPFGGFFGSVELIHGALPIRELVIRAQGPHEAPLHAAQVGVPPPRATETPEGERLEWTVQHLDPLPMEPLGPAYTEIGAFISISTHQDWARLATWYADLYRPQLQLDERARRAGRAATRGLEDPRDIVEAIFDHVVAQTRYVGIELGIHGWKPYAAREVHRRGYGDCKDMSTLLIALLAEHDIDASLVLVRTIDRGPFPTSAVNLWAFNHAVAYVPALDLYLDPTFERGGRRLPPVVEGALGLVVAPGGEHRLVELPEAGPEAHANEARYEAHVGPDGGLRLDGNERYVGAPAAEVRRRFEAADARARQLEVHMGRHFPGFSVEALTFRGLEPSAARVEYAYEARIGRYGVRQDDRSLLALSLFQHDLAGTYAASAGRETPIRVLHPWRAHNWVRYHLPDGARLLRLPDGLRVDTPWIALEQRVERTQDGFIVDDVVTFRVRRVPTEHYAAFRDACLAIDRAMRRDVEIAWD